MATTLTDMINEVSMNLSGYTLTQDRSTYLDTAITAVASSSASPTILSLGSTDNVGKGIVEIDEELLWIDTYDRVGNTATVAPYGRAYLGTTLAAHAVDAKVTISPTVPRFSIKRAINDTINALGSSIFAASTTTITSNAAVAAFRLPTTVTLDTTAFTSGQTISIYDVVPSGRTIQIVYAKDPEVFTTNAQEFPTQTGLPESCKDVVILGATYRLLSNLDPARAGMVSPQADELDNKRPYGSSQSLTKQVYALYSQRLAEEIKSQQDKYPIRVHYSL